MATFEKRVKQLEQVSCSKEEHSYCDVLIIPGGNGDLYTYEEHAAMLARKRFDKVPTSGAIMMMR